PESDGATWSRIKCCGRYRDRRQAALCGLVSPRSRWVVIAEHNPISLAPVSNTLPRVGTPTNEFHRCPAKLAVSFCSLVIPLGGLSPTKTADFRLPGT